MGGKRARCWASWGFACLGSFAIGLGCATDSSPESSASAAARANEPAFELASQAPWPVEYSADPLWARAAAGDDFDRARLARRESADGLLRALEQGGSLGRVALESLEHASDRRARRGALCALIERADGASRGMLLAALLEVVLNAPRTDEPLDTPIDARCPSLLEALAQRDAITPLELDRAAAVLARWREPRGPSPTGAGHSPRP